MKLRARLVLTPWLVGVSVAAAQPPDQPPPEPAPPSTTAPTPIPDAVPAPDDDYPRALVARPLLLPSGALEASVAGGAQVSDFGDESVELYTVEPRVKVGVGGAELELASTLVMNTKQTIGDITITTERWARAFAAGRIGIAPETSLGVELTMFAPTADNPAYQGRAVIAHKAHLAAQSAVELSGFAGALRTTFTAADGDTTTTTVQLGGQLRAQAQIAPLVAIEGRAQLAYFNRTGDSMLDPIFGAGEGLAQDYGIRLVGSIAPELDAFGGVDFLGVGSTDVKLFTVGVAYRRVP